MPYKDPEKRRAYGAQYQAKYLASPANRVAHRKRTATRKEALKGESMLLVAAFKAGGCKVCGERSHCCLSAHHLNPAEKIFSIAAAISWGRNPDELKAELAKCVCVCENCHRKIHAGELALSQAS